ncbi:ABC transporter ATP-binding protein [Heliomicrobium gestii]|nr:ABC transporter ATP-binding protein [Heliomicrobium gestii]
MEKEPGLLEAKNLNLSAGTFELRDITFQVKPQGYLVVVGPTGCGKTLLLEMIAGIRAATGGSLSFNGKDITALPPERRRFGLAYQDSLLYPFLSVRENILFGVPKEEGVDSDKTKKSLEALAESMEIAHLLERFPGHLSGGERQRVSLARALMTEPSLLLLDEPLSALDPRTRDKMQELLRRLHRERGIAVIHVTHDFGEAIRLGDQMLLMREGSIEQDGAPLDMYDRPKTLFAARFMGMDNLIPVTTDGGDGRLNDVQCRDGRFVAESFDWTTDGGGKGASNEAATHQEGWLCVRAEHIKVTPPFCDQTKAPAGRRVNRWLSVVDEVTMEGAQVMVICRSNEVWRIRMSLREWQDYPLSPGALVELTVDVEHTWSIFEKNRT